MYNSSMRKARLNMRTHGQKICATTIPQNLRQSKHGRFWAIMLCGLMLAWQSPGPAQELQNPSKQNLFRSFAATVGGDVSHIFSSPFRIKQKDGWRLLALTATTALFVTSLDKRIDQDFVERDDFYVKPAIRLAQIGDVYDKYSAEYVLAGLSFPMLAGGLILKDRKLATTGRLMIESFLIAGAITQLGKKVSGRARPYTGDGPSAFAWFKFSGTEERRSFPSGHATGAFALMTVLAKQYDSWWVEIPCYTLAVSVAMQRLDTHRHWGADVVLGGAIGYWVGSTLVNRHKQQPSSWSAKPYIGVDRIGVAWSF
ncbi:hypothetical protein DCC62_08395 [candidate division KSB1 bacterium]|nr:MAG: hypothetical protein DCC62_08395 [candidate division KSB1 bacterium]